jgi:hypothetical protein
MHGAFPAWRRVPALVSVVSETSVRVAGRAPPSEALYLARDVYLCVTQGHGVFLDLARDKYSAVILPAEDRGNAVGAGSSMAHALAGQRDALIEAGLLTTDPDHGDPIAAAPIEAFAGHIFGLDDQRAFGLTGEAAAGLNISMREISDFFVASWTASHSLKTKHISRIVGDVRRRKARAAPTRIDLDEVRRLTAVFRRLRPWYPRKYLCLYDSLALVEFLARRGVFPLWVFAVQAQPFGAHCWVQIEDLLLNEGTEYAGQFTPIMAV